MYVGECVRARVCWEPINDETLLLKRCFYIQSAYVTGNRQITLTYLPQSYNAVTCSNDHIFVAEEEGVNIHTWTGRHTQRLSRHQLGLQDGTTCIHAVQYISQHQMLQLAVGDRIDRVTSLHAYQVTLYKIALLQLCLWIHTER